MIKYIWESFQLEAMIFQILDANYAYDSERKPLVQLFGTTPEGQSVTVKAAGFRPYFYASAIEGCLESAADDLKAMGLEVEVLERFEPIGYQKKPKKMILMIKKNRATSLNLPQVEKENALVVAVMEHLTDKAAILPTPSTWV